MVSQWLRRKDSYSHDRFLPLCLFIVGRCKKVHLVAPLSLRPRARQRIVISFYPQAANSSPRAGRAKCERRLRRQTKPKPGTLQNGSRLLPYHTFAQFWSLPPFHAKCVLKKRQQPTLCQICQACEMHKNVPNFSRSRAKPRLQRKPLSSRLDKWRSGEGGIKWQCVGCVGLKERQCRRPKWYNQVLPVWNQRGGGETFAEKRGNFPPLRELGCSMVHFIPKILERLASSLPVYSMQ